MCIVNLKILRPCRKGMHWAFGLLTAEYCLWRKCVPQCVYVVSYWQYVYVLRAYVLYICVVHDLSRSVYSHTLAVIHACRMSNKPNMDTLKAG